MSATAEELKTQLARLSESERAEIAQFLLDSLDQEVDAGAEAAWDAELARRAEEIRSGQTTGEPKENVFARLRAGLR